MNVIGNCQINVRTRIIDVQKFKFLESMDWIGTWGKHMKSVCFKGLKESQKVNHFPGTFQIGRKDRLWKNLHKLMIKYGAKDFGLMPKTYVLPHDMKALKYDWDKYAAANDKWIIKPVNIIFLTMILHYL